MRIILFWLLTLAFVSCGDDRIINHKDEGSVPFSQIQGQIFNQSCNFSSCHSKLGRRGNLVLEPGESYSNLVNVPAENEVAKAAKKIRVVPGNPEQSFLIQKLTAPGPGEGVLMPYDTQGLGEEKIQMVRKWVKDGAKSD